jgi:hypothetical protein
MKIVRALFLGVAIAFAASPFVVTPAKADGIITSDRVPTPTPSPEGNAAPSAAPVAEPRLLDIVVTTLINTLSSRI